MVVKYSFTTVGVAFSVPQKQPLREKNYALFIPSPGLTDYSLINVIGNAVIVFDCLIDFRFTEILLLEIKKWKNHKNRK
jgi:hypothetical protein